jgi:hypothetical protein
MRDNLGFVNVDIPHESITEHRTVGSNMQPAFARVESLIVGLARSCSRDPVAGGVTKDEVASVALLVHSVSIQSPLNLFGYARTSRTSADVVPAPLVA